MRTAWTIAAAAIVAGPLGFGVSSAYALPKCAEIATNYPTSKAKSDKGNSPWKLLQSITSQIVPASGQNAAYCLVELKYVREINIRIGLPLNSEDGGAGGIQGAWNGKIQNLGGGGFAGSLGAVTGPTNTGYVGSSTDTGHNSAWCASALGRPGCAPGGAGFVLDKNNELLWWQVEDFITNSLIEQVHWAQRLAEFYYDRKHTRNYWNGCSTGGRQGMELAQKYGDEFDGIYAGVPAMNWNRFQTGELWTGTVLNSMLGVAGISTAKVNAANNAAIAACDANDGVVDGIIGEPRRCTFSAQALKCTGSPGDPATCLTQTEADAVDKVWDGARNQAGQRLWGGPTMGTSWTIVAAGTAGNLNRPGSLPFSYKQAWVEQDVNYDYKNVTIQNFGSAFQKDDVKFKDYATDSPNLDKLKNKGGKLITWHGGSDPLILPYGSWEYWGRVFDQYGGPAHTDGFFRAFFFPGVGHCGGGSAPQPPNMFDALVNWVENGVAPDYLVGTQGTLRTRKICKYPNEAVYNGTGSTDDEANFHCVVNSQVPADLSAYMVSAPRFKQAP
ncbi:MAG TPA: tannase/feruloyl esterase family alpha/beta hydrolase [Hyphomicrobiaceae bacterium]|nr:tannase/feruloyl esterase family alpha/beta hydrolase [Hyphomicrobiaceae bacterium]